MDPTTKTSRPIYNFSTITEAEAIVWAHAYPECAHLMVVIVRKNGKVVCYNGCRWSMKTGDRLVCITRNGVDMKPSNSVVDGVSKVIYVPVDYTG